MPPKVLPSQISPQSKKFIICAEVPHKVAGGF